MRKNIRNFCSILFNYIFAQFPEISRDINLCVRATTITQISELILDFIFLQLLNNLRLQWYTRYEKK